VVGLDEVNNPESLVTSTLFSALAVLCSPQTMLLLFEKAVMMSFGRHLSYFFQANSRVTTSP
jgi:hypothetical protein